MVNLRDKQINRLLEIQRYTDSPGVGMYPGIRQDLVPGKVTESLRKLGLIDHFVPHNPVHKDRWVITPAGRAALKEPRR